MAKAPIGEDAMPGRAHVSGDWTMGPAGPEDEVYAEARQRADDKLRALRAVAKYLAIVLVVGVICGRFVGGIVAFFGAIKLAKDLGRIVAPRLRERWIEQEVRSRVRTGVRQERQVLAAEHTRSLEELSASIAHDIRNPIAAARSLVQQMGEDPNSPENVGYARVALEELGRVERSVSHLLRFARDEELRMGAVRLTDVVDSALETFRDRIARSHIELVRETSGEGEIRGDAEKLRRVVINLVSNAIEAVDGGKGKSGHVAVGVGENLAGTEVWLRVADDGPGLDADALSRIWNPFYTSKPNGTGLGLPIVKKLVEAHRGSIEAAARPGGGAEFVAVFPKLRTGEEAHA